MRLSELIALLSSERLAELARAAVPGADELNPSEWPRKLELVLVQTGYIEQVVLALRPPVASVLLRLLESDAHVIDREAAAADVAKETELWCRRVTAAELGHRLADRSLLYRKMLEAAWANDLTLDQSELRMLRLLREQLGLFRIEHFLLAYHASIQPYWRSDDEFGRVVQALLQAGVIFEPEEGRLVLPREVIPNVRRVLDVDVPRPAARRLLARLDSGTHLKPALDDHDLPTSGSKQDRIDRIIEHFVPMHRVVDTMHIAVARDLVRRLGLPVTGSKEELVNRVVDHFANQRDIEHDDSEQQEGEEREPRELDRDAFAALFGGLKGHQLHTLLMGLELRTSGSKETRIATLWESPHSEATLLSKLKGPELEDLLARNELFPRGSKAEKIARLIAAFRRAQPGDAAEGPSYEQEGRDEDAAVSEQPPEDLGPTLAEGIAAALVGVELSSKSPTRFDPVRRYLSTRLDVAEQAIGVKYLGDAKNHRNRIGEALRGHPELLLLLAPQDEAEQVIEAAISRIGVSPGTCFALYCQSETEAVWTCRGLLAATESSLSLVLTEFEPGVELLLAEPSDAIGVHHFDGLQRRVQAELDVEWPLTDAPPETKLRRALHRAFDRTDIVVRTKHISDGRNVGNRISEAIGAGCSALVLIVPSELGEMAIAEATKQLIGMAERMVAIIIAEHECDGYSPPIAVAAHSAQPD